ncbi:MAG: prephenate dehydrogenase/arogenate dehydrogenase family protein [Lachnospiraceae bacterium]|nr:prephenate dehydrogenase/arogenate dehydrogenase family protein [Lachnospiraceae bacterium]
MLTCGFAGFGLIGGSIARSLKRKDKAHIIVQDPDEQVRVLAKKARVADRVTEKIDASFADCDIVFLSAPASHNLFNLRIVMPYLRPDAVLTDVSSVKEPIHRLSAELGIESRFVGGHPMCGSEKSGFEASSARFVTDACYILTKTEGTDLSRLARMENFVRTIGARPLIMTAADHDACAGAVSHLPHVAASALVSLVAKKDDPAHTMQQIAAGGFKDLTRIASSSPEMWRQILLLNGPKVSALIDDYIAQLKDLRKMIDKGDTEAIRAFFEHAKEYREQIQGD